MATPQGVVAEIQGPAGEAERGFVRASDFREERTMTQLVYAGIGSRATPPETLRDMTTMAAWLARRGWRLHSGGAAGADTAFAAGAPPERRTVFLPWPAYRGCTGPDCRTLSPDRMRTCLAIAADLHPTWHRCSPAARTLHARNTAILLGEDAGTPVHAVIAWTSQGRVSGGTGQGIRIADRYGIPVLNLGAMHPRTACERLEDIRAAASPATRPARSALRLDDGSMS